MGCTPGLRYGVTITNLLGRFSFDFNLMRRVKLNNRFFLQPYLRTRDFLRPIAGASEGKGDEGEAGEVADRTYELFAVMIHQGTARGGHYFAYIKVRAESTFYLLWQLALVSKVDPMCDDVPAAHGW